jgi:hypothetical protein
MALVRSDARTASRQIRRTTQRPKASERKVAQVARPSIGPSPRNRSPATVCSAPTNKELARLFNVDVSTIEDWMRTKPEFSRPPKKRARGCRRERCQLGLPQGTLRRCGSKTAVPTCGATRKRSRSATRKSPIASYGTSCRPRRARSSTRHARTRPAPNRAPAKPNGARKSGNSATKH